MRISVKRLVAKLRVVTVLLALTAFTVPLRAFAAAAGAVNGIPGGFDMNALDSSLVQAKRLMGKTTVPKNINQDAADHAAQKVFDFYKSAEYQQRLAAETDRLKNEVFKGIKVYYKDLPGKKIAGGRLPSNQRIYIFISSSVPTETLRTYVEQIAELKDPNIVVLMRGFIDGMKYVRPTLRFIGSLVEKDPSCGLKCGIYRVNVEVDPLLFRRFGIERVPAVVYVPDIQIERPGSEGVTEDAGISQWYAFYGDVAFPYALKRLNEEAKSASLAAVIKEFEHGFYK